MDDLFLQLFLALNLFVLGIVVTLTIQHWRAPRRQKTAPAPSKKAVGLSSEERERLARQLEANFQRLLGSSSAELEKDLEDTTARLRDRFRAISSDISSEELEQYHSTLNELQEQAKHTLGGLQSAVAQHQSDLTKKLGERQAELEAALAKRGAQLEAELNERQAELEANLMRHTLELKQAFKERQDAFEAELNQQQAQLKSSVIVRQSKLTEIQTAFDEELNARRQVMEQRLAEELRGKRQALARTIETKLSDTVMSFVLESLQHNADLGAQGPYLTSVLEEHKAELRKELLDE